MIGSGDTSPGYEHDALDLPPMATPPGYRRDGRGRWHYERGGLVPGARDITLASLYGGLPRGGGPKPVPARLVPTAPELAWCAAVGAVEVRARGRGLDRVVLVPAHEWERRARIPLGLCAPELMPERLLDAEALARIAGVDRRTIAAYRSRGLLPEPVARVGNSPAWSRPVALRWLGDRPGQGARATPRRQPTPLRRPGPGAPAQRRSEDELLRWADSILDDAGATDE